MKHKKKTLALLLALLLLLLAVVGGTFAYFTREARATNVITTGTVEMTLNEMRRDSSGELVEYPTAPITGVMPGTTVSKIPYVKNVGTEPFYARARAVVTVTSAKGEKLPADVVELNVLDGWVKGNDGWYYYAAPIAPHGEDDHGEAFFDEVTFSKDMGNEYQGCTVQIDVSAQVIQVKNNPIPDGGDVTSIKGWPAEKAE